MGSGSFLDGDMWCARRARHDRSPERTWTQAGAFCRSAQLERLFRDVQASRYHPMPEKQLTRYSGRLLLGLDLDG
jgi:acyl-CoA dehydrogenase